nr:MAG TPA: hypothetical protein [Bacteriophage sp.]
MKIYKKSIKLKRKLYLVSFWVFYMILSTWYFRLTSFNFINAECSGVLSNTVLGHVNFIT